MQHLPATLELSQIRRDFRKGWFNAHYVLQDISASIQPGSLVGLLGANGAGKTTLLRILAGWMPARSGSIRINDRKLTASSSEVRRHIMLVDERSHNRKRPTNFIGQLVRDYQVDTPGIEDTIANWFKAFELVGTYATDMQQLSKGQQFKLALIGLFVVRPSIWLLDEPYSAGLDAAGIVSLETEIKKNVGQGGIVIFSSQWPQHATRLANRALVLHEGQLAYDGDPSVRVSTDRIEQAAPALQSVLSGLGESS